MSTNRTEKQKKVIHKIKEWACIDSGSPSLLISQDNQAFFLSFYLGMGNSDCTPVEKLPPEYSVTITHLYQSGYLTAAGDAFSLYPGSGFFKKLVYENKKPKKAIRKAF